METRDSLPFNPTNWRLQAAASGESFGGAWHVGYVEQLFELSDMLNAENERRKAEVVVCRFKVTPTMEGDWRWLNVLILQSI